MRSILAIFFRVLFKIPFFKPHFFGIHKRIFLPLNLFKGVVRTVKFKKDILLKLEVSDWVQENLYFLDAYEDSELLFMKHILKDGSVFIDIGANIGLYSLVASKIVKKNGSIYAFEPYPKNREAFNENIALNNFKNIVVENFAIAEKEGEIALFYNMDNANLGMVSAYVTDLDNAVKVKTISLDNYVKNQHITKIDFIKLDIEGGEYTALLGMQEVLTNLSPILMIEILEYVPFTKNTNQDKIVSFLEKFGYQKWFISENGTLSKTQKDASRMNFIFAKKDSKLTKYQ